MKIAYVGDFINHGKSLASAGASIIFLLSTLEEVESIDVFCPNENEDAEIISLHPKIKLIRSYKYDNAFSLLRLLKLRYTSYDKIIFNVLSTSFGNSSITNAIGISIPIVLSKILGVNNVEVIYHNSVLTNDISKLGYTSRFDRLRARVLRIIESTLFKNVTTYVLLELYKRRIDQVLKKNKVKVLNAKYLEAISTVFLNGYQEKEKITLSHVKSIPQVILHGNWGPQKNIELAISSLDKIRDCGIAFNLSITGGISHHFPEYEQHFLNVLKRYNFVNCYKGPVEEAKIFDIFFTADLLLLPYNTPGGHSAVLEQAIFFEIPAIAIDFPEYREEADGEYNVILCEKFEFYRNIEKNLNVHGNDRVIEIRNKIEKVKQNVKILLFDGN